MGSRTINLDTNQSAALLGVDLNSHVIFTGTGTAAATYTLSNLLQDGDWIELYNFSKHPVALQMKAGQSATLNGPGALTAYSGSGAVPRLRLVYLQGTWHHG